MNFTKRSVLIRREQVGVARGMRTPHTVLHHSRFVERHTGTWSNSTETERPMQSKWRQHHECRVSLKLWGLGRLRQQWSAHAPGATDHFGTTGRRISLVTDKHDVYYCH